MSNFIVRKVIIPICFLILLAVPSFGVGGSGGAILKYSPGVRQHSLGGCGSTVEDDLNSINFNPSTLCSLSKFNISMLYDSLFLDSGIYYLGLGKSFDFISVGASFITFQGGDVKINDRDDPLHGQTLTAQDDYIFSLVLAKKINSDFSIGIAPKMIMSRIIEEYSASSYTGDFGFTYKSGLFETGDELVLSKIYSEGLTAGAGIKNIGGGLKYNSVKHSLPLVVRLGFSYPLRFDYYNTLNSYCEIVKNDQDDIKGGIGFEYNVDVDENDVSLRMGYMINYEIKNFAWGLGFKFGVFKLDYGMLINSAINNRHQVLLSFFM